MRNWRVTGIALAYCGACGGRRGFRFPDPRTGIERLADRLTAGLWSRITRPVLDSRRRHLACTACGTRSDYRLSRRMVDITGVDVALVEGPNTPPWEVRCWRTVDGRDVLVVPGRQASAKGAAQ